ncbi:hypothetical protein [Nocardioides sp. Root190]|uniref:hypothetical protein n=1 Tax=Nocardioides sp. Root190 TaxID=1736488 RepID=UPI000A995B61|nr:hypothetical protein [Nocardioides sp. Root190]
MGTTPLPHKHRATEPVPSTDRPAGTRAHRAGRAGELPIVAMVGVLLLVLAACLAVAL